MSDVRYKVHSNPDNQTKDVAFRVSSVSNGWLVKAGAPPIFCATPEDIIIVLTSIVNRFVEETPKDKT
jgi:hypothetical protein